MWGNCRETHKAMTEAQNRYRVSRIVLFAILWLTLFVLSVKVSVGWAMQSLSLMAESLHALIVSFSTLLSLLALSPPDSPPGREFYGHGKRETAITLLLAAFFGFACLNLAVMSVTQLLAIVQGRELPLAINVNLPAMQMLGMLAAITLVLTLLGVYTTKVLQSPALRFNASLLLKDIGLTILVLAGLLGVGWGIVWLDLLLAMVLVVLAGESFWRVVRRQLPLMVEPTAIATEVLAQIARQIGGVTCCYQIQSRGIVGQLVYVKMHLVLHPEFRGVASLITERIEGAIRERYGPVQATFYIDEKVSDSAGVSKFDQSEEFNGTSDRTEEN